MMGNLRITYVKSSIGHKQDQKDTVRSLGLRKLHQSVIRPDTETFRGMARKVRHLVRVDELDETSESVESGTAGAGAEATQ